MPAGMLPHDGEHDGEHDGKDDDDDKGLSPQ
jgi:hypothetical protein